MVFTGWRKWLNRVSSSSQKSKRSSARRQRGRLHLETLEQRLTPAVKTWTGASGIDILWSDANNWVNQATSGHQAPSSGDTLIFSSSTTNNPLFTSNAFTSNNDMSGLTLNEAADLLEFLVQRK